MLRRKSWKATSLFHIMKATLYVKLKVLSVADSWEPLRNNHYLSNYFVTAPYAVFAIPMMP